MSRRRTHLHRRNFTKPVRRCGLQVCSGRCNWFRPARPQRNNPLNTLKQEQSRMRPVCSFCAVMVCVLSAVLAQAASVKLRCDYRENPLGIDDTAPHFSWQSDNTERNWRQSAYQILVASSAENLLAGNADVWDSGKQSSDESIGIAYSGPALQSRKRYYWTVRVWDANGQQSQSTDNAWWEMGLLQKSAWSAKWIARTDPDAAADRAGMRWIWVERQNSLQAVPKSVFLFQTTLKLKEKPKDAALFVIARGDFKADINGVQVGAKHNWHEFDREDVTGFLKTGKNTIDIEVTVAEPNRFGPDAGANTVKAALAPLLKITRTSADVVRVFTDSKWKARAQTASKWKKSAVIAELGDAKLDAVPPLPPPAALLRRGFEITRTVQSARLYVTALGSYRMFLNGQPVSDDLLTPGFTDYSKRVQYQTYDVTRQFASGKNVLAAIHGERWIC